MHPMHPRLFLRSCARGVRTDSWRRAAHFLPFTGFSTLKEHMSESSTSSTVIIAPALSNSPQ